MVKLGASELLCVLCVLAVAASVTAQQQAPRTLARHHYHRDPPKENRVCTDINNCPAITALKALAQRAPNCTKLTDLPAAGGCGLIPIDVFQPLVTEFILEFFYLQNQLQSLTSAYNDLAKVVGGVQDAVLTANLPLPVTASNQTAVGVNALCGPPRKIGRNAFVIGFIIRDPASNETKCSDKLLKAFKDAMEVNVNSKDTCKGVNNTRVVIEATCTQDGKKTLLDAAVEIFSYYPCSYVPWYRATTLNGDTETACGPADPDTSCTCKGIAEPVCDAIQAAYGSSLIIVNDGLPLYIRFNNCGACLDGGDVFCSPDGYNPRCPIGGCTGRF